VAGEGRLPWSEVATICGTRLLPLSPYSPFKIRPLARFFDLPSELEDLLRYGRGVDTRRFAATGFKYNATSAGAVRTFIRAVRLRHQSGRQPMSYTYEHDIEQFFRHSPSVVGTSDT
jgi:UDP-glucose 4-epimerase